MKNVANAICAIFSALSRRMLITLFMLAILTFGGDNI